MLKTFGGWTFGGRDNWRSGNFPSRLLAAGTFGVFQKAYLPGHFLVRLLALRTFPAQTFGGKGQLALLKTLIFQEALKKFLHTISIHSLNTLLIKHFN